MKPNNERFSLLPRFAPTTEPALMVVLILTSIAGCATLGYDTMMMSSLIAVDQFTGYFEINDVTTGLLNSGMWIGEILITLPMAKISDTYGRKKTILFAALLEVVAVALQTASQNIGMFVFSRMLLGAGITLTCSAGPVLITELCPAHKRGLIGGIYFTMFQVGAIIATAVTLGTVDIQSTWAWRLPSLIQIVPSVCVVLLLPMTPESPRWKIMRGDVEYARQVFRILSDDEKEVDGMIKEIAATIEYERAMSHNAWKEVFSFSKPMVRRLSIGISLAWLVEMGGSSVGSYYLTIMLKQAGITETKTLLQINMISACWNFVVAFAACFFFDKLGRKKQAFISLVGMIICFLLLGGFVKKYSTSDNTSAQYATIFWMFLFNGFYSFCYTPLTDIYVPELFPTRIRVAGLSVCRFFDSGFGLLGAFVLSIAMTRLGWKFYIINACYDILFLPVIYYVWIETKQMSLESIAEMLGDIHIEDLEMLDGASSDDNDVERASVLEKAKE